MTHQRSNKIIKPFKKRPINGLKNKEYKSKAVTSAEAQRAHSTHSRIPGYPPVYRDAFIIGWLTFFSGLYGSLLYWGMPVHFFWHAFYYVCMATGIGSVFLQLLFPALSFEQYQRLDNGLLLAFMGLIVGSGLLLLGNYLCIFNPDKCIGKADDAPPPTPPPKTAAPKAPPSNHKKVDLAAEKLRAERNARAVKRANRAAKKATGQN